MLEGAGSLLQEGQVVQWIVYILLAGIAAGMRGNDFVQVQDVNAKRIGFHDQIAVAFVNRDGVAIGLEGGLTVWRQHHRNRRTALHVVCRQGAKG